MERGWAHGASYRPFVEIGLAPFDPARFKASSNLGESSESRISLEWIETACIELARGHRRSPDLSFEPEGSGAAALAVSNGRKVMAMAYWIEGVREGIRLATTAEKASAALATIETFQKADFGEIAVKDSKDQPIDIETLIKRTSQEAT